MALDIPFRLSSSADDADPDARLMVSSLSRRLHGHVVLAEDALVFEIESADAGATDTARGEVRRHRVGGAPSGHPHQPHPAHGA